MPCAGLRETQHSSLSVIGHKLRHRGVVFAFALASTLGCDEATVSLFPRQESAPAGTAGAPPQADPMVDGLVGHWPFDGNANDLIGGGSATVEGAATFVVDAVRGDVLRCDGATGIVSFPNETPLDFSYVLWLWTELPSLKGATARDGSPLLWSNVDGAEDDFMLALLDDHLAYMSYSNPSTGTLSLIDKVWHHIVVTRKDGERVALYVDGQLDGDGNSGRGTVLANPLVSVCGNLDDGRRLAGRVDDLRQYARVLSAEDVQALYAFTLR